MKKALIAMSGGVDSSVAALLMKEKGYECMGVTMKLFNNGDICIPREHSCCSLEDVEDARYVSNTLGMPHYVFNFTDRFKEDVIDKFVYCYENGITPNPCIDCNRYLKFEKLFQRAKELECEYIVTGHYAKVEYNEETGRYILKKADDLTKDQSYVLYQMTQEQLKHTMFPLGGLNKTEVRKIAEAHDFINAKKHDSQDICFVQNGSYADFIEEYTGKKYPPGNFVDINGNVLGRQKGIIRYTVGQRKGLGISHERPLFVLAVNSKENTVILTENEGLFTKTLTAKNINLITTEEIKEPVRLLAKIRYSHKEQPATVVQTDSDTITVEFDEPQRAITKGQAVVLYDGDTVVGGGIIS